MQACTKLICPGLFTENWRCNLQHSNRFKNRTLQIVNSMRDQFKVSGQSTAGIIKSFKRWRDLITIIFIESGYI